MSRQTRLYPRIYERTYVVLAHLKQAILKVSLQMKEDGTLLDYGCGDRPYYSILQPKLSRYISADLGNAPHIDLPIVPNEPLAMDDQSVDYVLSSQVLEHVPDVGFYLKEAHRVLKKDGLLILSTHGIWIYHPHPLDLWRWTSQGLRREIESAGFEIQSFEGILSIYSIGLQLWQDSLIKHLPRLLRYPIVLFFQTLILCQEALVSQNTKDRDASHYLLVAKKLQH